MRSARAAVPWVPEPKIIKRKQRRKESFLPSLLFLSSFSPFLLPISFHLNFEALVPRVGQRERGRSFSPFLLIPSFYAVGDILRLKLRLVASQDSDIWSFIRCLDLLFAQCNSCCRYTYYVLAIAVDSRSYVPCTSICCRNVCDWLQIKFTWFASSFVA